MLLLGHFTPCTVSIVARQQIIVHISRCEQINIIVYLSLDIHSHHLQCQIHGQNEKK